MIRGLYTASSGMMLQMARQDVLANNLANANTSGFKRDMVIAQEFPSLLLKRMGRLPERIQFPGRLNRKILVPWEPELLFIR